MYPVLSNISKTGADLENQITLSMPEPSPRHRPSPTRAFANPQPLGLTAFATSIFLISLLNLKPQGVQEPNVIYTSMIFIGGLCQYIAGIMEFISANTFGFTVFSAFAGFNVAYALIFIPGTGVLAAYEDSDGNILPELNQAIAMFMWAWFIVSVIFTVAAMRSNWVMVSLLSFLDLTLLFIAIGNICGSDGLLKASSATGFASGALTFYAAAAGLWNEGSTPFNLPLGSLAVKTD